jgi:hypothetical protein
MTWDKMKVSPEKKQEDSPVVSPKPKKKKKAKGAT